MKHKKRKKEKGTLFILEFLHLYFLTFFEMKYTLRILLSLNRTTLFRKSTSNILLSLHKDSWELGG